MWDFRIVLLRCSNFYVWVCKKYKVHQSGVCIKKTCVRDYIAHGGN